MITAVPVVALASLSAAMAMVAHGPSISTAWIRR